MTHPLYHQLFDDAALFPPGNAPMGQAVPAHRGYRSGWRDGYVGPFLVADGRVAELRAVLAREEPAHETLAVAVTVPGGPDGIGPAVESVLADPALRLVGVEAAAEPGAAATVAGHLTRHLPPGASGFVEVSRAGNVPADLDALVGTGHSAKFRTGGLTPEAHPGEAELAAFVTAVLARGLPFKCTAGLHHAVRHTTAEGFEQHGFLNLLVATAAAADGAGTDDLTGILADRDGAALVDAAARLTPDQAEAVRARFVSFGTCSVVEPLEDLVTLGALVPDPRPH
ncbi:hypothetical protein [Nocardiopsis sp. FIRDI 009]|uniref:hypothetical protein n=1 Tax=Nocardiopsis sp. FIRDI 009 TaxID=714197 RepID=UPI000E27F08C|nr:hypothetical protein [Nocardiopsis sp. FIRDI 009]